MRILLRALAVAGLMLAAACAGLVTSRGPTAPGEIGVRIEARRIPLGVAGADLAPRVRYAGGLALYGANLHGLSDLKFTDATGAGVWAVSDLGTLVRFRLRLNRAGRLVGADDGFARVLIGPDGGALTGKDAADAEGLAVLDDGRLAVSFERQSRIWTYPADGGPPAAIRAPDADFPPNRGMEGLARAPGGGWLALGEEGGAWLCRPARCDRLPGAPERNPYGWWFTAADVDPAGGWFVVQRPIRLPPQAIVRRMAPDGSLGPALIRLRPPASVDNMEGIAVRATPTGARLYLLSDDNRNPLERTLLMAFDVPPKPAPTP